MSLQKSKKQKLPPATTRQISASDDVSVLLKEETIRWILSIICSLLAYLVVAAITLQVYHPNVDLLIEAAHAKFLQTGQTNPKPMESLLFRLGVAVIICGLPGFYALFSKNELLVKRIERRFYSTISILCIVFIAALIYFDFAALNPFGPANENMPQNERDSISSTNFAFYFDGIFIGNYLWVYLIFIVPLMTCLFIGGIKKYQWEQRKLFKIISSITGYIIAAWTIIVIVLMNTYDFPYSFENKYDFNAVYYSMTQVYAGLPMLVSGFTNTYGLYPHFLNPLFQLTGLNVFKFSLTMSLLTGAAFILNFYFLKQFVRNRIILFLGFTTVIFFSYLDFKLLTKFDSLFSLFPIRYIVPSVLIFLATIYFNKRSTKIYVITFLLMALFILWNPEMGIVSYLSWLIVNIYTDLYNDEGKLNIKKVLFHCLMAIATVVIVFSLYELAIYTFYGAWPDLSLLFEVVLFFGKYGVGNLPMTLVHPWNLIVLILLCGFLYSLIKLYKKEITASDSMIFLVSLISLGYFFYFEGRSQNSNFALSSSFSLILLTILGDKLWGVVKKSNVLFFNMLFVVFLFLVSFSFVEILYNTKGLTAMIYQEEDKNKQSDYQQYVEENKDFIVNTTQPGQKIIVIAPKKSEALLFDGSKRASGVNPGSIDMFLKRDMARLEHTLRDSNYSVFIELSPGMYSYLSRSIGIIAAKYELVIRYHAFSFCNKRKTLIPSKEFFHDTDQRVVHRKYYDDTLSTEMRVSDATGVVTKALSPEFSVQMLFYSKPQVFAFAGIVNAFADSNGFKIGYVATTSKYYFGVNNVSRAIDIPFDKWAYCVMNVYPDHFIVYVNGTEQISAPLSYPVKKSDSKVFIGNINGGQLHHYAGAISEVAVSNKAIDTGQIQHTWEELLNDGIAQ